MRYFNQQNPSKFNGELDPDKAYLWLEEMEKIFEMLHCTDAKKVEYATFLLGRSGRGEKQIMENNNEVLKLETFKQKFLDKYFPSSARSEKEAQFLKLYQGYITIFEHADKFESLAKHFHYFRDHVDEDYKCERFENGLRYEIKESVEPLEIRQFQALVEKCKKVERMKRGRVNRGATGGPSRPRVESKHYSGELLRSFMLLRLVSNRDTKTMTSEEGDNIHTIILMGMRETNPEYRIRDFRGYKMKAMFDATIAIRRDIFKLNAQKE